MVKRKVLMDLKKVKPLTNEFLELSGIGAWGDCLANFLDSLMIRGEMMLGPDGKLMCDIYSEDSAVEMENAYKTSTGFGKLVELRSSGAVSRRPRKSHALYGNSGSGGSNGIKKKVGTQVPRVNLGPNDGVLDSSPLEGTPSIRSADIRIPNMRNPNISRFEKKRSETNISIEVGIADSLPDPKTPESNEEKLSQSQKPPREPKKINKEGFDQIMVALSAKLSDRATLKSKHGQKNAKISAQNLQPQPIVSKNQTSVLPLTVYTKHLDEWITNKLYNLDALLDRREISEVKIERGIKFVNLNLMNLIIKDGHNWFNVNLTINYNFVGYSAKEITYGQSLGFNKTETVKNPIPTIYDELLKSKDLDFKTAGEYYRQLFRHTLVDMKISKLGSTKYKKWVKYYTMSHERLRR